MINRITILILNIRSKFKRKKAEYLNFAYKLELFTLAMSIQGGADMWKVFWIIGFAVFASCCYGLKLGVERKRAQLAQKVWFLTPTNFLEFVFPLFYLPLAFAYYMELRPKNHHTNINWKTLASSMKICVEVLTFLIIVVIGFNETCNTAQQVEDKPVEDAHPPGVPVHIDDVESQSSNRPAVALQMSYYPPHIIRLRLLFCQTLEPEVVQRDVKNQAVNANVEESMHRDVDNKYVADANVQQVAIQIYDVENQSYADANGAEVALQMDAENYSVANADPPGVAIQIDDVKNRPEVALQMDAENQSYAYANRPDVALQMDSGNQSVEDADPPGVP